MAPLRDGADFNYQLRRLVQRAERIGRSMARGIPAHLGHGPWEGGIRPEEEPERGRDSGEAVEGRFWP